MTKQDRFTKADRPFIMDFLIPSFPPTMSAPPDSHSAGPLASGYA